MAAQMTLDQVKAIDEKCENGNHFCVNCRHWVWLNKTRGVGGCMKLRFLVMRHDGRDCEKWERDEETEA